MTLLRGRRDGIEIVLAGRDLDEALAELEARLAERADFYRGVCAVARFGAELPSRERLERLRWLLQAAGIELRAIAGTPELEAIAVENGVAFEPAFQAGEELERRRALRPRGEVRLSEAARSLVADFAGARLDIADRRKRGEASVPKLEQQASPAALEAAPAPALRVVETPPGTLYHAGTLRGGQALHHVGNIVVVGDVNPGAELIATGDILVFGRLAGVAHAGAQGDENARVYAVALAATQLRIAAYIAADDPHGGGVSAPQPEAALVREGRIVLVPLERLGQLDLQSGVSAT